MRDQWGNGESGQGPTSPQDRYYERYLQPEGQQSAGSGQTGPGDSGSKKVALIAGGLAAALAIGIGGFAATRGDDSSEAGSSSTTTTTPASPTTSGSTSPSTTPSSSTSSSTDPRATLPAEYGALVNPGWKIVEGKDTANAAYEIPQGGKWDALSTDTYIGWMADNPDDKSLVTTGASTYDVGFCASAKRQDSGFIGFVNIGTRDPAEAAPDVVSKAARLIAYNKDTKKYAPISQTRTRQITVNNGSTTAVESLLVVDNGKVDAKSCDAKKYEMRTVAFTGNKVSTMLLIFRQQDGTSKMPDSEVDGIIKSLRPKK